MGDRTLTFTFVGDEGIDIAARGVSTVDLIRAKIALEKIIKERCDILDTYAGTEGMDDGEETKTSSTND